MQLYQNHASETYELLNSSYISTSGASFESQLLLSDMCHFHARTHIFSLKSPIFPISSSLDALNVLILPISMKCIAG